MENMEAIKKELKLQGTIEKAAQVTYYDNEMNYYIAVWYRFANEFGRKFIIQRKYRHYADTWTGERWDGGWKLENTDHYAFELPIDFLYNTLYEVFCKANDDVIKSPMLETNLASEWNGKGAWR